MPSPFPGMDPFLEDPAGFRDFHDTLVVSLRFDLQARLPPGYFTRTNRRVWIEASERPVFSDLDVSIRRGRPHGAAGGGVAAVGTPLVIEGVATEPEWQTYLEVFDRNRGRDRLVTAVEVLSPINKRAGENARGSYLQKQRELIAGSVSLLEIDLLREGVHSTAVDGDGLRSEAGRFDYHVCLSDTHEPGRFFTYPFTVRDPLPVVAVPLSEGCGAVSLPLQEVFTKLYDGSGFRDEIDYTVDPPPPAFPPDDAAWVRETLAAAGFHTPDAA